MVLLSPLIPTARASRSPHLSLSLRSNRVIMLKKFQKRNKSKNGKVNFNLLANFVAKISQEFEREFEIRVKSFKESEY